MTAAEEIKQMMADAYSKYKQAMKDQSEPNKYRANYWKGKHEGHRESLVALERLESDGKEEIKP